MSGYFDAIDNRIRNLKEDDYAEDGTTTAYNLEMELVRDVTVCAMLPGFPEDLKRPIHETVLKYGIHTLPRNAAPRDFETFDQHRELLRRLSSDLHTIFHAVGHSESPGFSDNPLSGLRNLYDKGDEEREALLKALRGGA